VYRENEDRSWVRIEPSPDDVVIAELTRRPEPRALVEAIKTKDLAEARRLVERFADPHGADANGYTAMTFAVKNQDLAAAQLLLRAGIGPNDRLGRGGVTPLAFAAAYGALDIWDFLVAKGAKLSVRSESGTSPLGFAVLYGQDAIVKRIEASGWTEPGRLGVTAVKKESCEVGNVVLRSTADRLGLRSGDRIVAINGAPVATFDEISAAMAPTRYGDPITVSWQRGGERGENNATAGPAIGEPFYKKA
jgi:membrane-associated protease RseP (regulator of RpoE activity)